MSAVFAKPGVRVLCVLGIPGTGANVLSRFLTGMDGVHDHGELFNPAEPTSRRDPGVTLDLATDLVSPDVVAITIYPGHVSRPLLAEEVLARPDVASVVLRRRVIECYTARLDALSPAGHLGSGTAPLDGDVDDFARWAARNARWYRWCVDSVAATGRRAAVLTFEEQLEAGPAPVRRFLTDVLRSDASRGGRRSRARAAASQPLPAARPSGAPERFRDWDRFRDDLADRGLLDLAMGYFA